MRRQIARCVVLLMTITCVSAGWAGSFSSDWANMPDRSWIGQDYWSNPMPDWELVNGRLECVASGGDRNVALLTRDIIADEGNLEMRVRLGRIDNGKALTEGWAGFKVGVRGYFKDYRDSALRGDGMNIGVHTDGRLFIGKLTEDAPKIAGLLDNFELRLRIVQKGTRCTAVLTALDTSGKTVANVARGNLNPVDLTGLMALACSAGKVLDTPLAGEGVVDRGWASKPGTARGGNVQFWFDGWIVQGSKIAERPEHAFGPILFAQHSLSRGVMKITAQMPPIGEQDNQRVQLQVSLNGAWKTLALATIDPMARTAEFRIADWDSTKDTPYRLTWTQKLKEGVPVESYYTGTVRKDPVDKEKMVIAAFTGNNDLGFPHQDVVNNVTHFKPDFLVFTGDQIYEGVGGYGLLRKPVEKATLSYLRKWYLFGWEYSELLRDTPSVCLPDDHDVFHGNVWGAGGKAAKTQDAGGYTMPPKWVNMVQRTQTSHMPDPYDPTPVLQGISVYYCDMILGGVSFAVVEDRKFKSAPAPTLPAARINNGWAQNPDFDSAKDGDVAGAELLGARQEKFLENWAVDWSDKAWMKIVLSQTIFADLCTLPISAMSDANTPQLRVMDPGEYAQGEAPVQDHDSNGWPQTPRNRALLAMRRGFASHIAGDQHLGSTIQYGVDDWRDAGFALCVPSVANVWPRRWFPSEPGKNPLPGQPRYTGDFLDGFGNKVSVHAVSNPIKNGIEPTAINHRAPGYGIISIDRKTRRTTFTNWPRWVDASQPDAKPYPGWPVEFDQLDNYSRKPCGYLPTLEGEGVMDQVVQVINEKTDEIVYALRLNKPFAPMVFEPGVYTIKIGDPDTGKWQSIKGLKPGKKDAENRSLKR